jgi:hypothetical protein
LVLLRVFEQEAGRDLINPSSHDGPPHARLMELVTVSGVGTWSGYTPAC